MTTDNSNDSDIQVQAQVNNLNRLDKSVAELNARIARLAMVLDLSLEDENTVHQILNHHPAPHPLHAEQGARFQALEHEHVLIELRGLLVMRYGIEEHIAQDQGASVTRKVLAQAEAELSKSGFKPGADGLNLNRLFQQS